MEIWINRYATLNSINIYEALTVCWVLLSAKDAEVNKTDKRPCLYNDIDYELIYKFIVTMIIISTGFFKLDKVIPDLCRKISFQTQESSGKKS